VELTRLIDTQVVVAEIDSDSASKLRTKQLFLSCVFREYIQCAVDLSRSTTHCLEWLKLQALRRPLVLTAELIQYLCSENIFKHSNIETSTSRLVQNTTAGDTHGHHIVPRILSELPGFSDFVASRCQESNANGSF
jgi:hypothetical protein